MTRRTVLGILAPFFLVVLHFILHVGLSIGRAAPDLLTLALLLAVRERGMGWGGALGFFLGLLEDAFSILAFGANALAMTVVGILGARTRELFVGDSILFFLIYLASGKLLREVVHWAASGETMREPFMNAVLIDGGLAALYMALVGLPVVLFFGGARGFR
ncbi:MAG: rod shape-determining protein MreD [Gemmatimonadota bacterium]